MDEHAVVTAAWAEAPIYCRIVPWSERILGMSRPDAMEQRARYERGEVWCACVSAVYPEGFEASLALTSMRAISADEYDVACADLRREAGSEQEVALTGSSRRVNWLRRRATAAAS